MLKIKYFIKQSWLLIVSAFIFGLLIAVTNAALLDRINTNNANKVIDKLKLELVPKVSKPSISQAPIINCIKAVAEGGLPTYPPAAPPTPLDESEAKALLKKAKIELDNGNIDAALENYHTVFDRTKAADLKKQALEGMAAIASPKSLSRIVTYCRNMPPILLNYKDPDPEVKSAAIKCCIAIAMEISKSNKERAIRLLKQAAVAAGKLEVGQQVSDAVARIHGK